jgi:hypothetical protein
MPVITRPERNRSLQPELRELEHGRRARPNHGANRSSADLVLRHSVQPIG